MRYYHGKPFRVRCERHGCMVDGICRQFGFKWVGYLKCGHRKFLGYVKSVDEIKALGWERTAGIDPRIEKNKSEQEEVNRKERENYLRRREHFTLGKYL